MDSSVLAESHSSKAARFLDGFAAVQQFVEDFLSLGNGWLLLISTGVALFALMLDVRHMAMITLVLWALAQIFGVDLQFFVAMVRAHGAYSQKRWGAMALWIALALVLAAAIWQALYAFGVENATGATEAQVFQQWGMSIYVWLGWRAFLVILLMSVAAITRHSRTITDAQLAAATLNAHVAPTTPTLPTPPTPRGGLPAPQAAANFAPAQVREAAPGVPLHPDLVPVTPARSRRQPAAVAKDPRTGRTSVQNGKLRAEREAFAKQFFAQYPNAGQTDLAQALGIQPGGVVQTLWTKFSPRANEAA